MQYALCGVDHLRACSISGVGGVVMLHGLHPDTLLNLLPFNTSLNTRGYITTERKGDAWRYQPSGHLLLHDPEYATFPSYLLNEV